MQKTGRGLMERYRTLEAEQEQYATLGAFLLFTGILIFVPPPKSGWVALLGLFVILFGFYCLFLAGVSWKRKRALIRGISAQRALEPQAATSMPSVIVEDRGSVWKWLVGAAVLLAVILAVWRT